MAAKPEEKPKDPAPGDKPATAAPMATPAVSPLKSLLPALAALVLAPAASWATAEFVILPRLQKKLAAPAEADAAPESHASGGGHGKAGKEGKSGKEGGAETTYEFANVVVNLSGTMGTRYLKTSFLVTGSDPTLKGQFETKKPQLTDVTLSVLSSLTLADLEEPGSKNVLREKLTAAYNQALGKRIVEQVYFSDFVIQ
jgi:flagellar FliL protein